MVVNKEINKLLIELGFTDYEAKAYLALLLQQQPATAYEIAKASGIPTSKIYEIVSRLLEKKVLQTVTDGKARGQKYLPLNAKELVESKRQETIQKTERLGSLLESIGSSEKTNLIWPLNSKLEVFEKASQFIQRTEHSLLVSLWPEELEVLENDLQITVNRKVKLAMVHFGIPQKKIGATYYHPVEQTLYEEKGGRGLTLVVDRQLVLMATFFADGHVEGAWSRNQAFVTVAEDYIRHDVYITKVTTVMEDAVKRRFGENYEDLRNIFKTME